MSNASLAFRILVFLYNAHKNSKAPAEDKDPNVHYWNDAFEIATGIGLDLRKTRETLKGLKSLGMVDQRTDVYSWCFRGGPTFRFLNNVSGEFTQDMLREGLGVSRPTASRRMRLLSELGLIKISRAEAVPGTGGRRLWFRRS